MIEAGGFYEVDNGNLSQIPAYHTADRDLDPSMANEQPLIDWGYVTDSMPVSDSTGSNAKGSEARKKGFSGGGKN